MSAFATLKETLDSLGVQLVAVSKTKPVSQILAIYEQGQRIFGENRVQELVAKHPQMPADVQWHMIGHLQTNKVKMIAPFISMIHSVDSLKLLRAINKEAVKNDRTIDVLLQFKIAEEETKYGLDYDEFTNAITKTDIQQMGGVRVRGVMGMASFVSSEKQVRSEFAVLRGYFDALSQMAFTGEHFDVISMGMSGDYAIAIEEGSTMVRIGSLIFGER